MSVNECARVLTRLSRYVPSIVTDPRMKMSKFVSGVSDLIEKECSMDILKNDTNIDHLVIHAQRFEREKLDERSRGPKRKWHDGKCLAGTKGCYSCGGSDNKMRDCPILMARGREKKKTRSDALQARGEQEFPPNVAPGLGCMVIRRLLVLEPRKVIMSVGDALSLFERSSI
uniref:Polyprotein n=1 Tax=Solanum tuberosum TaxID=4113 RepID=M1DEG7_SOLTU